MAAYNIADALITCGVLTKKNIIFDSENHPTGSQEKYITISLTLTSV